MKITNAWHFLQRLSYLHYLRLLLTPGLSCQTRIDIKFNVMSKICSRKSIYKINYYRHNFRYFYYNMEIGSKNLLIANHRKFGLFF